MRLLIFLLVISFATFSIENIQANTRTTRRNSGQPNRAGSHQWAQKQQVTKKNPQRNFKPVSRTQNGMVQTKSPRGIKESVQNSYHGAKTYLGKHRRQAVSSFQAIKPRLRPHTKNSFQPNQKQNHWPRLRPQRHSSFPAKQNSIPRLQAQLSSKPKPQQQAYSEDDIPIAYPPDQQQNANGGSASQSNGDLCSQQCSLADGNFKCSGCCNNKGYQSGGSCYGGFCACRYN